jgi:hypothetical protein
MTSIEMIGITERGDAALDTSWIDWVCTDKPAILISKAPLRLYRIIVEHNLADKRIIVHATITGYAGTVLEPYVEPVDDALKGYKLLSSLLGEERTVLRIDPIIPTEKGFERARLIAVHGKNRRIRISLLDNYVHIHQRFREAGLPILYDGKMHALLEVRRKAINLIVDAAWTAPEVCGEPDMICTPCVGTKDCELLGVVPAGQGNIRPGCKCLKNKTELLTEKKQCAHSCLYCYWR